MHFILCVLFIALTTFAENSLNNIKEEKGIYGLGYITPNEPHSHLFDTALKNRIGTFIAVGTFRLLNESTAGNFDHVISLDHDEQVGEFNNAHHTLIRNSKNRHEYLMKLLGRDANDLLKKAMTGEIDDETFVSLLESAPQKKSPLSPEEKVLSQILVRDYKLLFFRIQNMLRDKNQSSATIFGSDNRFKKAQKYIEGKKVTVVTGGLGGEKTLLSISKALKKSGEVVSVIDLSNAQEHLIGRPEAIPKFLLNLKSLPFSKDGLVLFTSDGVFSGEGFTHFSIPYRKFIDLVEKGLLNNEKEYKKFMERLAQKYRVEGIQPLYQLRGCASLLRRTMD